jgi:hypothetical protein
VRRRPLLNTLFDPVLEDLATGDLLFYVVDLYARDGERPFSLERSRSEDDRWEKEREGLQEALRRVRG